MGSEGSGRPIFIFFNKENCICSMIRHHAESDIDMLLTRILPIDQTVKLSINDTIALFMP